MGGNRRCFIKGFLPSFRTRGKCRQTVSVPNNIVCRCILGFPLCGPISTLCVNLGRKDLLATNRRRCIGDGPMMFCNSSVARKKYTDHTNGSCRKFVSHTLGVSCVGLNFSNSYRKRQRVTTCVTRVSVTTFIYSCSRGSPSNTRLLRQRRTLCGAIQTGRPALPCVVIAHP